MSLEGMHAAFRVINNYK